MAKLYFRYGVMGSGKSDDLIRTDYNYKEKGMNTIAFKPRVDTREGTDKCIIKSRTGKALEGIWLDKKDFLTNGFIISKNKEESFYLVSIMINQNLDVEDSDLETAMYCCTPDINIDFQKTRGRKAIYSYSKKSEKKIISYVKQNAQKKALDSLVKEIGDDFINELNSMIFGK